MSSTPQQCPSFPVPSYILGHCIWLSKWGLPSEEKSKKGTSLVWSERIHFSFNVSKIKLVNKSSNSAEGQALCLFDWSPESIK